MKKKCLLALIAAMSCALMACGKKADPVLENGEPVAELMDVAQDAEEGVPMQILEEEDEEATKIDVSDKLQIFADNKDAWYLIDDSIAYMYTVADFEGNGNLILVRSALDDRYYSDTTFFRVDASGQIEAVNYASEDAQAQPDFVYEIFDVYTDEDGACLLYANDLVYVTNDTTYVDYDMVNLTDDGVELIKLGTVTMGAEETVHTNKYGDEISEQEFYTMISDNRDLYETKSIEAPWCDANALDSDDVYGKLAEIYDNTVVIY